MSFSVVSAGFGPSSLTVNSAVVLALSAVASNVSSGTQAHEIAPSRFQVELVPVGENDIEDLVSHHMLPIGNERAGFGSARQTLTPGSETRAPMWP